MRILVTGANGFVGRRLCEVLDMRAISHRAAVRSSSGIHQVAVGSINGSTCWAGALNGCDTVVHLAARVHVMKEAAADPLAEFRKVNVAGTLALAEQAHRAGVRRFVFVSSIKVNGESTSGKPFSSDDEPRPIDHYGVSKLEAEQALGNLAKRTGLEVVIVRPPLIYGPGVRANFLNLVRLVQTGLPLPFGRATGLRSMLALDNLVDFLILCCTHPQAVGETYLVSDGVDLSVRDLVIHISKAFGRQSLLIPVPQSLLSIFGRTVGKQDVIQRLIGSLQVDSMPAIRGLGWKPPLTPEEGITLAVNHYLRSHTL